MITSNDVAQIFASQGQMFAGQGQYAQQIGLAQPPMQQFGGLDMSGGLANYPMQQLGVRPVSPFTPPMPQFMQPAPPFRPAPMGFLGPGMGGGNAFAGNVLSGVSGAAGALGAGASMLGMFGKLGMAGNFIDPFSAGMGGFSAARAAGMGMWGAGAIGAAAALPVAAGGMFVSKGFEAFMEGARGQQLVGNTLERNFNFYNPQSRSGQGFSRDDAMAIGSSIRQLAHIPEMMTSVEELTKLLPKLKSMGVLQGAKTAEEFEKRFTSAVKTISDISKVLGSTMDEAAKFFEHSRSVGFLGRRDQLQNVLNMGFAAGQTGSTVAEIGALQQSGAGMARGMGARGRYGAEAVTTNVLRIQSALDQKTLREDLLQDYTGGLTGAEGARAATERFTGAMVGAANSAAGKGIMIGMMKMGPDGKPVLDEAMAEKFRRGELTREMIQSKAASLTDEEKRAFVNNPQDLAMQFSRLGPGGMYKFAEMLTAGKGKGAAESALRMWGFQPQDVEFLKGMSKSRDTTRTDMMAFRNRQIEEARIRGATDISGTVGMFAKRQYAKHFGGVEEAGAQVFNAIGEGVEDIVDLGLRRATVSVPQGTANEAIYKAFSTGDLGKDFTQGTLSRGSKTTFAEDEAWNWRSFSEGLKGRSTYKTRAGDVRYTLEQLGVEKTGLGAEGANRLRRAEYSEEDVARGQRKIRRLRSIGEQDETTSLALREIVHKLDGHEEFKRASPRKRADMIRDYLKGGISRAAAGPMTPAAMRQFKEAADIKEAVEGALQGQAGLEGTDWAEAAVHMFAGDLVGMDIMGETAAAVGDLDIESASRQARDTRDKLKKTAKSTYRLLQKPGMEKVLAAATKDPKTRDKVLSLMTMNMDPETAAKKISAALGQKVEASDLKNLRGALMEHTEGGTAEAVSQYLSASKVDAVVAAQLSVGQMQAGIDTEGLKESSSLHGLKASLSKVATAATGNKFAAELKGSRSSIEAFAKELLGTGDEKARSELLSRAGEFGGFAETAMSGVSALGPGASLEARTKALTEGIMAEQAKRVTGATLTSGGGARSSTAEDLRSTLGSLNTSIQVLNTKLQLIVDKGGKAGENIEDGKDDPDSD